MIRKEEDEVGLAATGVYLAFHTQTESCATSTQYNTVHKQHKGGLSWAKRVPSRQNRQSAVCPSLPASPSPVPLCGLSTPLTGTRQVFVICTWPTSPKSLSRCRPHWTTPPSPHTPTARLRPGSHPACSPPSISGEEVSHSHLYTRSVDHLEFKRLQSQIPTSDPRVAILHAVEALQRGVVRTESEFPSQEIISEGEDIPPDSQTLLLYGVVFGLSLRELATNVQHRPFHSLYLLGQDCTPLSDALVCNKKGREKSGECNSGLPHRAAFTWIKACWHSSIHWTGSSASFLVRSVSGLVRYE